MKPILPIHLVFFFLFLWLACGKNDEQPPVNPPPVINPELGLFVSNEGNFQQGNASISFIDLEKGVVTNDFFRAANARPLGDVLQSITILENRAYLIVNNSDKIEVVNYPEFTRIGEISNLTAPRYLLPLDGDRAYVSDIFANTIHIVDLKTMEKTGEIPFPGWSEQMLNIENTIWVSRPWLFSEEPTNYLYLINQSTNQLTDSVQVGYNPSAMALDKNGHLWVYCNEVPDKNQTPILYVVDPSTKMVVKSIPSPPSVTASFAPRLEMNPNQDTVYFIMGDLFRLPIEANIFPRSAFLKANGQDFYGLGVHPEDGTIFVGDAAFFQQKGVVSHFKQDGSLINEYSVGVGPNGFFVD